MLKLPSSNISTEDNNNNIIIIIIITAISFTGHRITARKPNSSNMLQLEISV